MPRPLATVIGDPDLEAEVATALGAERDVELVMRCVDRVELLALVRSRSIEGVIAVGHPHWLDEETVQELFAAEIPSVGVSDHPLDLAGFERLRIRSCRPSQPIGQVVERLFEDPSPAAPSIGNKSQTGDLVAIWGPKGAPGRTTVAIELAFCLASTMPRTFLIDTDPYGGDIVQRLGIVEDVPTLIWAARLAGKGEWSEEVVARELRRAGNRGPVVLPGLPRAELWAEVSEYGLGRLIEASRHLFDFMVADVGFCLEPSATPHLEDAGRNRMARGVVGAADRVIAVVDPQPCAFKAFVAAWSELITLVDPEVVTVVGNRVPVSTRKELSDAVRSAVGRPVQVCLPDVWGDAQHALKRSRSILESRPRCSLGDGIRTLAASLGARVERKGLLIRLGGKA